MICDAHVHIGYYLRIGCRQPYYYSPKRIEGILKRCGVSSYVVSSTCAQIKSISINEIVREAREIRRVAGSKAHIFFWLSGRLYDDDNNMQWLKSGMFDGIKLHNGETPWTTKRQADLRYILTKAQEMSLPVMIHSGEDEEHSPSRLAVFAREFLNVRFNFAHCRPMDEMAEIISSCPNVWTDTAYMPLSYFKRLCHYNWHDRLMFGTDIPVWQAHEDIGMQKRYSEFIATFKETGLESSSALAFSNFINPLDTIHDLA